MKRNAFYWPNFSHWRHIQNVGAPANVAKQAAGSFFEPSLDSDVATRLLRIHPQTLQRMAQFTPTRANVGVAASGTTGSGTE
jgi:hypothetical protein